MTISDKRHAQENKFQNFSLLFIQRMKMIGITLTKVQDQLILANFSNNLKKWDKSEEAIFLIIYSYFLYSSRFNNIYRPLHMQISMGRGLG